MELPHVIEPTSQRYQKLVARRLGSTTSYFLSPFCNQLVQRFHPSAGAAHGQTTQSCLQSAIKSVVLYLRLPQFCQGEMQ